MPLAISGKTMCLRFLRFAACLCVVVVATLGAGEGTLGRRALAQSAPAASADSVARLTQRLIDMEAVMVDLTGKVEELQHQNQLLQQRLQQSQQDNEFRFGRVEQATGVSNSAGASASTAKTGPLAPLGQPVAPAPAAAALMGSASTPAAVGSNPASSNPATPLPAPMSASGNAPAVAPGSNAATASSNGFAPASGVLGYLPNSQAGSASPPATAASTPPSAMTPAAATADTAAANAATSGAAVAKPPANATPEQVYNYAFSLLRQNDYTQAEGGFRDFVAKYPKHELASNAQYWLGQSFVVRGDYKQAEVALLDGYRHYPKGAKAPDTLYLLGVSAGKLGQIKEACAAFKRFSSEYPAAPDALKKKAATEKQQLGCTG